MRHKVFIIVSIILLIMIGTMGIGIKKLFFTNTSGSEYGNRLDGIENVKINEDTLSKIAKDMKDTGNVSKANYRIEGRIVNFIVYVNSGVLLDTAKTMGDFILGQFTKEQLEFYDIQLYLLEEKEDNTGYSVIGYKHKTSDGFVW